MRKANLEQIYPLNLAAELKEVGERFVYESGLTQSSSSVKQSLFNDRMRKMLLGIGVEFILRAAYVNQGFVIHEIKFGKKTITKSALRKMTVTMKTLIDSLEELFPESSSGELEKTKAGLNAARILRNDCIHYGFEEHTPGSVEAVLYALLAIYKKLWSSQVRDGALVFKW
ncbi:MAG TPA: hypothetical protein VJG90_03825 [Candidatus Nanoarchaeia archaeon]|nr:hypothetical protein [Candidatus Nanoarchaeia archaeon]